MVKEPYNRAFGDDHGQGVCLLANGRGRNMTCAQTQKEIEIERGHIEVSCSRKYISICGNDKAPIELGQFLYRTIFTCDS